MTYLPQYIYIGISLLGLGVCMAKHGQPRLPHNFGIDIIGMAIIYTLLISGGFFKGAF